MSRVLWNELARALGTTRRDLLRRQSSLQRARVNGVDRATLAVCRVLQRRSSRFDPRRFLKIVGVPTK